MKVIKINPECFKHNIFQYFIIIIYMEINDNLNLQPPQFR